MYRNSSRFNLALILGALVLVTMLLGDSAERRFLSSDPQAALKKLAHKERGKNKDFLTGSSRRD